MATAQEIIDKADEARRLQVRIAFMEGVLEHGDFQGLIREGNLSKMVFEWCNASKLIGLLEETIREGLDRTRAELMILERSVTIQ